MHDPAQLMLPLGQDTMQLLPLHTVPPVHALVQVPQLFGSLLVFLQTPLQFVCPLGQQRLLLSVWPLGQAQLPSWQVSLPVQGVPMLLPAPLLVQLPLAPQ
jgi:hypothetical protein